MIFPVWPPTCLAAQEMTKREIGLWDPSGPGGCKGGTFQSIENASICPRSTGASSGFQSAKGLPSKKLQTPMYSVEATA